ncbi:hypothetical protein P8625_02390 [Tenacibaculum tangerinum]|uniref:Gliding motility-associated C-terminal domain-containing protein n=1 Tax=Tenacibaculum tangerinum TaxID=3038772 RepID=A0ABY8L6M8_9FLAO|nr:hypothetical protein [Tenacibaculum tangerinum]WGH76038.1 hypothetical protein P8625_02390 [Tenacibaculum tangerinum]
MTIILYSINTLAQAKYRVEFFNLNYRINKGVKNNTSSNINIQIHYANGTKKTLYYRPIRNRGDNEVNYSIAPFTAYSRPIKITCYVFVNFRTGTDAKATKEILFSSDCIEGAFSESYSPRMTPVSFSYNIYPIINLTGSSDNNIAPDQFFLTSATSGFLNKTYIWRYKLGTDPWKYVSTRQTTVLGIPITVPVSDGPILQKRPQDFLQGDYIGKTIQFMIETCNSDYYSTIVSYYLIDNPPKIVSHTVKKTTCNYSSDGGITLNFERQLHNQEKMLIALYIERENNLNTYNFYKSFSTENLIYTNGNYTYTIPEELDKGMYQVKYQTLNRDMGEQVWTSLTSRTVKMEETTKVDFKITAIADQNCFAINDGYIDVSATGETNRTFLYQLTKNGELQIFNGVDWIQYTGNNEDNDTWFQFANASTTRINNLNKGAYKIRVKDSQGCFAKQ